MTSADNANSGASNSPSGSKTAKAAVPCSSLQAVPTKHTHVDPLVAQKSQLTDNLMTMVLTLLTTHWQCGLIKWQNVQQCCTWYSTFVADDAHVATASVFRPVPSTHLQCDCTSMTFNRKYNCTL